MSARLTHDSTARAWRSFSAQKHHLAAVITAARSRDGSLSVSYGCVSVRRCVPSRGKSRCCPSSTPRSAWRTPTWLRRWRPRGRPSGSVSERTRSSTPTTRCTSICYTPRTTVHHKSVPSCCFVTRSGAEQPSGSRNHQDALHDE